MRSEFLWRSGTSFGPRYLIPTIAFAVLGLPVIWSRGRFARRVVIGVGTVSIAINWLGAQWGAADLQSTFPLRDRFVAGLLEHGPTSTAVRNAASLFGWSRTNEVLFSVVGLVALGGVVFVLLRSPD